MLRWAWKLLYNDIKDEPFDEYYVKMSASVVSIPAHPDSLPLFSCISTFPGSSALTCSFYSRSCHSHLPCYRLVSLSRAFTSYFLYQPRSRLGFFCQFVKVFLCLNDLSCSHFNLYPICSCFSAFTWILTCCIPSPPEFVCLLGLPSWCCPLPAFQFS